MFDVYVNDVECETKNNSIADLLEEILKTARRASLKMPLMCPLPVNVTLYCTELLLVEQLSPRSLHIARSTSLLRAFILWWMVGHGLDTETARPGKAVEYN